MSDAPEDLTTGKQWFDKLTTNGLPQIIPG